MPQGSVKVVYSSSRWVTLILVFFSVIGILFSADEWYQLVKAMKQRRFVGRKALTSLVCQWWRRGGKKLLVLGRSVCPGTGWG